MITTFQSPPPRDEAVKGKDEEGLRDFMIELMTMMEEKAPDEKTKYECGIMTRTAKIQNVIPLFMRFSNPTTPSTIDERREAFECVNKALAMMNAFVDSHEIPAEPENLKL